MPPTLLAQLRVNQRRWSCLDSKSVLQCRLLRTARCLSLTRTQRKASRGRW